MKLVLENMSAAGKLREGTSLRIYYCQSLKNSILKLSIWLPFTKQWEEMAAQLQKASFLAAVVFLWYKMMAPCEWNLGSIVVNGKTPIGLAFSTLNYHQVVIRSAWNMLPTSIRSLSGSLLRWSSIDSTVALWRHGDLFARIQGSIAECIRHRNCYKGIENLT